MGKKVIFVISIGLNVLIGVAAILLFFKLGGYVYFENRIAKAVSGEVSVNPIIEIRNENLKLVGNDKKELVFLGDSHTNYFEWGEYFSEKSVANRGIGSDTTKGVLERLDQVTELNPKKVFIMVGINDIQQGVSIKDIEQNFADIIKKLRESNPDIEIYIQSVLPVAGELYERNFYRHSDTINESVLNLNEKLANLSDVTFINVAKKFGNELSEEYTVDGIHLNQKGYEVWLRCIDELVKD